MKIGIDGIPLSGKKTGVGHYTFEIAHGLATASCDDQFHLLSHLPYEASAINRNSDETQNLHFSQPTVNSLTRHWWTIGLPMYIRRHGLDLFHGTNYDIPVWGGCPTVLTIHDLSSFLFADTQIQRRARRSRRRLPTMARLATRIIVPTESVKTEVCEQLGVSPGKIRVIYEAPRKCFHPESGKTAEITLKRLQINRPFILYVGTIEPRKNVLTLVLAFEEIYRNTDLRPQLVLAGPTGWLSDDLFMHVEHSPFKDRVLMAGYLGDFDLRALYSSCAVLSYPALYEGAGLPPLEAMACGAPVVTTNARAISEMVGDAAIQLPAKDHEALATSLIEILTNEQAKSELSARGIEHAAKFTWERAAAATYETYVEAMPR